MLPDMHLWTILWYPIVTGTILTETFWKTWHLIYKCEVGQGLCKETIIKIEDVIECVTEIVLCTLADDLRCLLLLLRRNYPLSASWNHPCILSLHECSWWLLVAGSDCSCLQALLELWYWKLQLNLICDPDGEHPRLFIHVTPELTKSFLGKKELYSLACLMLGGQVIF